MSVPAEGGVVRVPAEGDFVRLQLRGGYFNGLAGVGWGGGMVEVVVGGYAHVPTPQSLCFWGPRLARLLVPRTFSK